MTKVELIDINHIKGEEMAYLHCHTCGWEQDDFYTEDGYNPANSLQSWMKQLCGDKIDEPFSDDAEFLRENGNISTREVIAREFDKFARRIRKGKWFTYEQFKKEGSKAVCPNCGNRNFDID
jgi:hypothetical protein